MGKKSAKYVFWMVKNVELKVSSQPVFIGMYRIEACCFGVPEGAKE